MRPTFKQSAERYTERPSSPVNPRDFIEPLTPPPPTPVRPVEPNFNYPPLFAPQQEVAVPVSRRRDSHSQWNASTPTQSESRPVTATGSQYHQSYPKHHRSRSGIDTLASIASARSPTGSQYSTHYGRPPFDTWASWPQEGLHHHAALSPQYSYDSEDRPSKRARSEVFPSPEQRMKVARPATSHVSTSVWSYNVEHGIDARQRLHTSSSLQPSNVEDAGLLTYFKMTGPSRLPRPQSSSKSTVPDATSHASSLSNGHDDCMFVEVGTAAAALPSPQDTDGSCTAQHESFAEDKSQHSQPTVYVGVQNAFAGSVESDASFEKTPQQIHTPPEDKNDSGDVVQTTIQEVPPAVPLVKQKYRGWPKGKPRGKKLKVAQTTKTAKSAAGASSRQAKSQSQLPSPQSLGGERSSHVSASKAPSSHAPQLSRLTMSMPELKPRSMSVPRESHLIPRPSVENLNGGVAAAISDRVAFENAPRSSSVLIDIPMTIRVPLVPIDALQDKAPKWTDRTICSSCQSTRSPRNDEKEDWVSCEGCNGWFHIACAGFKSLRESRQVAKFICTSCKPKHGASTLKRKSERAHSAVDYAGLNQGVLRTSDETFEHHYIQSIKEGKFKIADEEFARLPPERVTASFFELGGFTDPVVIPAALNPRPKVVGTPLATSTLEQDALQTSRENIQAVDDYEEEQWYPEFEYESVPDEGQDKLDMVIPRGLTVDHVAELYGPEEEVEVIEVKDQEGGKNRWNMRQWAAYYKQEGEKPVRNVISLEVSKTKLGRLIRRPKVVRDLDLQDSVWPVAIDDKRPAVQFYVLMSVADCFTDFHIDFGGSSVYYHILKGKKTFFFIPPTKENLKTYEDWNNDSAQNWTWLGSKVEKCFRVDLSEGDTMLIPAGWIHAVWTPENSLVIGGNFLTRLHYSMQFRIVDIEKNNRVALKFRYPFFQKVMWFTVINYLKKDPLPASVVDAFHHGQQFAREQPLWYEFEQYGEDSDSGEQNYNARYYSQAELDGLPDLVSYIFRTVLISLGRIEGVTEDTRRKVRGSIPKAYGEPLELAKSFALWTAWKRGNEDPPQWAHPDAILEDKRANEP
ncbi:JmjC domain-containing histone demethylation protein 1, partial [Elasticomyces elasticus]